MNFILDENISAGLETPLKKLGHVTLRLPQGAKDTDLIAIASKEKTALITHDKDFLSLPSKETKGIIVLRIHPPRAADIIASLKKFLATIKPSDWEGKLVLLEKNGFHIRV